jgi:hypothetical protein
MTDTIPTSMYLHRNGMFHLEISKFNPTDSRDPPVQEPQFELLKISADDHLIIQKKSPKIINEVFLLFHYIC